MKINLAVVFGGRSVEHEISIISSMQAIENLDKNKYNIIPVYISKNGNMYSAQEFTTVSKFIDFNEKEYKSINFIKDNNKVYIEKKVNFLKTSKTLVDVALLVVHGTNVEDGKLQGYFETLGLAYTGPSVLSGAVGQDKAMGKDLLKAHGVNQTEYIWITESDNLEDVKKRIDSKIKYPVIIKPANLGSSIGISIVKTEEELESKVKEAFNFDSKLVIEEVLQEFSEYNISFLGTPTSYQISPIEKVIKEEEFLSFEDKYISGGKSKKSAGIPSKGMASLKREIPANISGDIEKQIIENASKAFRAINARSVVRFDVLVDSSGNVYINEINNVPGSLGYYFWQEMNIEYSKLLDEIIDIAVNEHFKDKNKIKVFNSNVLAGYSKVDNES